jgi:hypothetical protein
MTQQGGEAQPLFYPGDTRHDTAFIYIQASAIHPIHPIQATAWQAMAFLFLMIVSMPMAVWQLTRRFQLYLSSPKTEQ